MERSKRNTSVAGIDVSKAKLDVAVHGLEDELEVENSPSGFVKLVGWLKARGVLRVGLEASGGYERAAAAWLREKGMEVVIHQPAEVRAFARFRRIRAKNDRIDARLIAAATAQVDTVKAACDPLIIELCERLTAYEQAADLVAQMKTYLEHVTLPDLRAEHMAVLKDLQVRKLRLAKDLIVRVKGDPALSRRLDLVTSLPGVGQIVGVSLILRMPELGAMERGQPAALIGVAPFDRDSGRDQGQRHIQGGRARVRRMLFMAAWFARRTSSDFKPFADRLLATGKKPKVILVAVMRKLIEAANVVLARASPWVPA
jgi:transposase